MANPIAPGAFSRDQLRERYHGNPEVVSTRDYRVFYNPETDEVDVQVRLDDTQTGQPVWFHAVSYTAA